MESPTTEDVESVLSPYRGFLANTYDALLVFEAASRGIIPRVARRLHPSERQLISSGAIFVYDERESDIKRWRDDLRWSPSRRLGNFLVYRELEDGHTTGGPESGSCAECVGACRQGSPSESENPEDEKCCYYSDEVCRAFQSNKALEKALVGSLQGDSYRFQVGGLLKKSISFTIPNGSTQHIISYYSLEDIVNYRIHPVSTISSLRGLRISGVYMNNLHAFPFPPKVYMGTDGNLYYLSEHEEIDRSQQPERTAAFRYGVGQPCPPYGVWLYPSVMPPHARTSGR